MHYICSSIFYAWYNLIFLARNIFKYNVLKINKKNSKKNHKKNNLKNLKEYSRQKNIYQTEWNYWTYDAITIIDSIAKKKLYSSSLFLFYLRT